MRILFIAAELPYPDTSGGRKYTWQKIKQLGIKNEVTLIALNEFNEEVEETELNKYVKEVYFYPRTKNIIKILANFYQPYSLISRRNKNLNKKIKELIEKDKIDAIILDSIHMYANIDNLKTSIPIFLTQHNIEYKLFESISKENTNVIKKMIYNIEKNKLKHLEIKLYKSKRFRGYIFISEEDMKNYKKEIGNVEAICIPPAIEIKKEKKEKDIEKNAIIFTGKMNYEPNIRAVQWFVEDIFPIILKEIPDAKFYVVGKNPTPAIMNYEKCNIIITGMVKDMDEFLNKAQIIVIPLLNGGGVKIKLFEALASKNVVVTTSKGIEGTIFENNRDLYVEDDAINFAKRCIEILENPCTAIAEQGNKTLIENYEFENLREKLQKFIEEKY